MKIITINTEENDDWMKTLPGYKDELPLHKKLAKKGTKRKKVSVKKQV